MDRGSLKASSAIALRNTSTACSAAQQRRRQREDCKEDDAAGGVERGQVAERELEHRHPRSDHDKTTPAPKESKEAKSQSENSSIVTIGSDQDKTTPVTQQKKTDLAKSDNSKSSSENSTIASVASSTTANADPVRGQLSKRVDTDASGKTVATCKRYFPTVARPSRFRAIDARTERGIGGPSTFWRALEMATCCRSLRRSTRRPIAS